MGIINHNAVLATTWSEEHYKSISIWISERSVNEQMLFLFGNNFVNGARTIVLIPDGSKEGWVESDKGDALRRSFIERLEEDKYEDGSSPWDWIEVGYGEYGQKVLRGNCKYKD